MASYTQKSRRPLAFQYFITTPSPPASIADSGCSRIACKNGTDPVNPSTGGEYFPETDVKNISADDILSFARFYNSLDTSSGALGASWRHSYSRKLILEYSYPNHFPPALDESSLYSDRGSACVSGWVEIRSKVPGLQAATASYSSGTCSLSLNNALVQTLPVYDNSGQFTPVSSTLTTIHAYRDDGHILNFSVSGSSATAERGISVQLRILSNGYQLIDDSDTVENYDSAGKLLSVVDRAGTSRTLSYDATSGLLTSITDNFGHSIGLAYDAQNRLHTVTGPDGSLVNYDYDANGRLATITNADGSSRQYNYADPNWATGLSSLIDENGQTVFSLSYDGQGRVLSSKLGGVASAMNFQYNPDGTTTETDSLGAVRTFTSRQVGDHLPNAGVAGARCEGCDQATTYDANGFVSGRTDFNGNLTTYVHDARGLETSRTEASGTPQARTINTVWESSFRLPQEIDEPGRTTTFTHDASGNMLSKTVTDTATGETRVWSYTYDSFGRVLTVNGPRTDVSDVTTYTYYTCTTGRECGQIHTITDALGHVMTFNSYDASGQPLTITDANGVQTTLIYDARQRLTSRNVGGAVTRFAYDGVGQLTNVFLPDNSGSTASITYAYDPAHRLTDITDNLGNHIHYTLDAMGNRIKEDTFDPSNTLRKTHTQIFDVLNQLRESKGANGQTTTYAYDAQGNQLQTAIKTPGGNLLTQNSFDALNRLIQSTDAAGGVTQYQYNQLDQLVQVTDPKGLVTKYTYNALGDLKKLESPDTGTTTYTYDATGNRLTQTDARGITATYTYDALNRLKTVSYPSSVENVTYTYDAGINGIGHLTGVTDQSGSTAYTYDPRGTLHSQNVTISGHSYLTTYAYDLADHEIGITYPSGRGVSYTRNLIGEITGISATLNGSTTTLASNLQYLPFSGWTQMTLGSGLTPTRVFDQDYRVQSLVAGNFMSRQYDYGNAPQDARDLALSINDQITSAKSQSFTYDNLSRLTSASGAYGSQSFSYDADGNRTNSGYTYAANSNHLTAANSQTYTYDAAGNVSQIGINSYDRNDAGRLSQVRTPTCGHKVGSLCLQPGFKTVATYTYNAQGERVTKNGATVYEYDQQGHLIGEATSAGKNQRDYLWIDGQLFALIDAAVPAGPCKQKVGSICVVQGTPAIPEKVYYAHLDHLGTPQVFSDQSQNVVWSADYQPFGTASITNGTITQNVRLPGQYFDQETGLYQNWNREYDPTLGRYIEFDPLGLKAGINMYAYVDGNPLSRIDPTGEDAVIPFPIPDVPAPPPAVAVGAAGIGGFMIGTWLYPHVEPWITRAVQACTDDDKDKKCEENLKRDLETCAALGKRGGKAAYRVCEQQAMLRYGNCLSGRDQGIDAPLPSWGR